MIRRKNNSPVDIRSPSPCSHSPSNNDKSVCADTSVQRPCVGIRPRRRYSYNLAPDPDQPSTAQLRSSSITIKHVKANSHIAPTKSLEKNIDRSKMAGRLRKGHLYNESTSLRHSNRSLSRSRDTLQLDTFNNSGNQTHFFEEMNTSLLHIPEQQGAAENAAKCSCQCRKDSQADRQISLESYLTFKQPDRLILPNQRQETDP